MISVLHSSTRQSEKLLEDAQYSGQLVLTNRKLKDVVLCSSEHDLTDVTHVDFSKNGLNEVPLELCEWYCLKQLILSYNFIKVVPDFLIRLRLIQVLDLSNNLLSNLPSTICELSGLVVFRVSNNCIVTLPGEIGALKNCEELDVSGNELSALPTQIGSMESLLHLDVARNNILELPNELCQLPLVHLNANDNRISRIPLCFQKLGSINKLTLDQNPLVNPPVTVLKKGKVHLFKYLQIESMKSSGDHENLSAATSRGEDLSSHPNLDFLANVVDKLASTNLDSMSNGSTDDHRTDSIPSSRSSPRKRACNTNVLESQISEEKQRPEDVPSNINGIDTTEKPERKIDSQSREGSARTSPIKKLKSPRTSPVKRVKPEVFKEPPVIKNENTPRNLNHNRRSSKEAKLNLTSSFPGYTPTPAPKPNVGPTRRNDVASDEAQFLSVIKPRKAYINRRGPQREDPLSFTMRRRAEKMYEEMEKLEKLRQSIEVTLKMPLPQDLLPALTDGVVLCHLANHIKARSIPTIHVPSPAVPKLSMAKCRRNVDNFLDACQKLGVPERNLCAAADILHERGVSRLSDTVNCLLKLSPKLTDTDYSSPTVRITPQSPSRHNQV